MRQFLQLAKRLLGRARPLLLILSLIGALAILLWTTHGHQPIQKWLFWNYAAMWLWTLVFGLSSMSIGHALLQLAPEVSLPLRERLTFDFAAGVLVFALGIFLAGVLRLLRGPFFYVYPVLLLLAGARPLGRYLVRAYRQVRRQRRVHTPHRPLWHRAVFALGILGIVLVYVPVMTPDNVAFDAHTYHLAIAEHYASQGAVRSFPEGWYAGTLPHLSSWLYTWTFTTPAPSLFFRIELAAHLEFLLFLATLLQIPLLVEALVPRKRAPLTWVLFFLFPGLFLYDSSLGVAADHVLAFWAAPIALATYRIVRNWTPGRGVALALVLSGAALTKYQALGMLLPVGVVLLVLTVQRIRRDKKNARLFVLQGPGLLLGVSLLATAPHWLANTIWHGNPVYPLLGHFFPSRPWVPTWRGPELDKGWEPTGTFGERLWETLQAVFTFSFKPHDWPAYHRDVPIFGFLFTLSLLPLPFLRQSKRVWLLAGGTLIAVFVWYWTYHQDRYLQGILPWMVAVVGATLLLAWAEHWGARLLVTALLAFQLIWGGDVPFFGTHVMMHQNPLKRSIDLLSSTFRNDGRRFEVNTGYEELARAIPKEAVVLFHEEYQRLGLRHPGVADSSRWQGAIDYVHLGRPDAIFDQLSALGVSHIAYPRNASPNQEISLGGELAFFDFVTRHGVNPQLYGEWRVVEMPPQRPPSRELGQVAYLGCKNYGVVPLLELDAFQAMAEEKSTAAPSTRADLEKLIEQADYLVVNGSCYGDDSLKHPSGFASLPDWGEWNLSIRALGSSRVPSSVLPNRARGLRRNPPK